MRSRSQKHVRVCANAFAFPQTRRIVSKRQRVCENAVSFSGIHSRLSTRARVSETPSRFRKHVRVPEHAFAFSESSSVIVKRSRARSGNVFAFSRKRTLVSENTFTYPKLRSRFRKRVPVFQSRTRLRKHVCV